LARLGGAATTTPSAPPPAADHPAEQHQPQPGPSASSRLLNSTPAQSTSTPKSAPKASTSTPPVTRPVKRPSPTSVRAEPAAAPAIRKPAPPPRLPVPYPEWEAQRIQGIFSVTLSVGPTSRQFADDSEVTPKGATGHYAGSRSCTKRLSLKEVSFSSVIRKRADS
jgi:hypothetical protein